MRPRRTRRVAHVLLDSDSMRSTHPTLVPILLSSLIVRCGGGPASTASPSSGASSPSPAAGTVRSALDCPATPSPGLFGTNALCTCSDLSDVGELVVGSAPANGMASVGVDGASRFVNATRIDGAFGSWGALTAVGDLHVGGDVITAADVDVVGRVEVDRNLSVGGDLDGVGELEVHGAVAVAGSKRVVGGDSAVVQPYSAPSGPPCDCSSALDVRALVEAASRANSNAAHNLGRELSAVGSQRLTLTAGTYYFDSFRTVGETSIRISGAVALYLGTLDEVGAETFVLDAGATLDLYVADSVRTVGAVELGDPSAPSSFRLYIGGTGTVSLSVGEQRFHGMIYAPRAAIAYTGDTHIEGGLFADSVRGVGRLEIDGAQPQATSPGACSNPPSSNPPISL
jgi:putative adhesin